MIELRDVSKTVMSGTEPLTILHPLSLQIPHGQFVAIVGTVGQRQVDAARADRRPRRALVGIGPHRRRRHHRGSSEDALARLRGEKIGFVFQFFHLIPSLTAYENVAVPMEIAGARRRPAARRAAARGGRADRPRASLSVAAVGRRAAARRARRARSRTTRRSCSPTSRPATSTAPTAGTSWSCCGRFTTARGTTHRPGHARRRAGARSPTPGWCMRDGRVVENTLTRAGRRRGRSARRRGAPGRSAGRRADRDEVRAADGGARNAVVVAAAAVLLRLHRRRRRRHRRAAVGDPERPRRHRRQKRRSLIAADVLIATNRDWPDRGPRNHRSRALPTPARPRAPRRSRRRRWCGRPIRPNAVARMAELRAVQANFPLYGVDRPDRTASPTRTRCSEHHGVIVRPELLTALGVQVGDRITIGQAAFTIRATLASEPGRRHRRLQPRPARADRLRRPAVRPALLSFGSRADRRLHVTAPDDRLETLGQLAAPRSPRRVHQHAVMPIDRGSDRPRLRARRELPEPGRPDHRHPRRHRGVERHPRLHPAEDAQHRGPEMRRRAAAGRSSASTSCR